MSNKLSKSQIEDKKKEIVSKIKEGRLCTTKERPTSAKGEFWSNLLRIKDMNGIYEPFVQCVICQQILSYEVKNGTNSLNLHVQSCTKKTSLPKSTMPIDNYVKKDISIPPDDKRMITVACSKYCAFDMRSFNSVNGEGFKQLCQALIDLSYKYGLAKLSKPSVEVLLPDRTNISRTIKQIANEYRLKMNDILREDLKEVKLIGISTDYWKNSYTRTKSGENTIRIIKSVLRSYDLDPDDKHIIYLTDNASNFVSGLKNEVASEQLSSDQEPTLHLVLPWINKLKSCCEIKNNELPTIKYFKKMILEQIKEKVWLTRLHDIATFLHPVTKNLLSYSQKERNDVYKATRDMMKTINIIEPDEKQKQISATAITSTSRKTPKK
ncbi:unnamed protein product, partial [Rotaria sordida]